MNSAINNAVQQYLVSFMDTVAERFSIDRTELDELWKETQKKKFKPAKRSKKRSQSAPTAYILFCKDERPKITGMSFAETAKELGLRWKNASDAVKEHYKNQHKTLLQEKNTATTTMEEDEEPIAITTTTTTTTTMEEDEEPIAIATTTTTTTAEEEKPKKPKKPKKKDTIPEDITDERERDLWVEFAEMTISELRTQCDHNNIKRSKNRNDMILSLIAHRIALEDGNTGFGDESDPEEVDETMDE